MSKIDCNITENYLKEKVRMTQKSDSSRCSILCTDCPLNCVKNGRIYSCYTMERRYPTEAIAIVQKWSDEHPVKTIKDDFLEKHPNAHLHNDLPVVCIKSLGYIGQDYVCPSGTYAECKKCWNRPLSEVQE